MQNLFFTDTPKPTLSIPFRNDKVAPINSVRVTAFLANMLNLYATFTKSFVS